MNDSVSLSKTSTPTSSCPSQLRFSLSKLQNMMIPRNYIISSTCMIHVTWRCHNQNFYLQPDHVKKFIKQMWLKYKTKHDVKIFAYTIMNNHVHFVSHVKDVKSLSSFLRITNSRIAKYINKTFQKDSAAIKDRFTSSVIQSKRYLINAIGYIWLNPYRGFGARPEEYPFSSAFFHLRGLQDPLINSLEEIGLGSDLTIKSFVQKLINSIIKKSACENFRKIFTHRYFCGSRKFVEKQKLKFKNRRANTS